MKVVVVVRARAAMLRPTPHPWMTLTKTADAAEVSVPLVGKKNVSTEVDFLRGPLELAAGARKLVQMRCAVDDILGLNENSKILL